METNEIIENFDVQDVNEVVEDVVNSDMGIFGKLGVGVACTAGVGVIVYGGYKLGKFIYQEIKEARQNKQSDDVPVEVETEVIEN